MCPPQLADPGRAAAGLELPPIEPERLLALLRAVSRRPGLAYAEPPHPLGGGGEAVVESFALADAPPGFEGRLVLRRLLPLKDPSQVEREAAVHRVLAEQGFPVPRVLRADAAPEALGAPYLVMEHVPGRILLEEVTRPSEIAAHPARIPRIVYQALVRVPALLGELQARLHALDPEPMRRALPGGDFGARLALLAQRIDAHALDGLRPGLAWLRANRPRESREVICHGDFVFTNVCVDGGQVRGVFDWSMAGLADPAYDVAASLARLQSHVPGLPPLLAWIARRVQGRLVRRYLASYRRSAPLDPERLRYFEAYWLVHEMVWSGERLRAGAQPDDKIEHRWLHAETLERGVRDFEARTGARLEPLRPGAASAQGRSAGSVGCPNENSQTLPLGSRTITK